MNIQEIIYALSDLYAATLGTKDWAVQDILMDAATKLGKIKFERDLANFKKLDIDPLI